MYKLSKRSSKRLEGVWPQMALAFKAAIEHSDCPDDFGIPPYGGLRSTKDQQELYAKGRTDFSTHSKPVTYVDGVNKKSNHQAKPDGYGYAIDVYIYDHKTKRASWDTDRLEKLARHIQKIAKEVCGLDITWGGDWKWKDMPHFECKGLVV